MSMLCVDWMCSSSGALSVMALDPRPLMLLYQILRVCGFLWAMVSPKWACWGERENGFGKERLRFPADGGVGTVDCGGGRFGGLVGCDMLFGCREVAGGVSPPSDVMGSRNKAAGTLVCLWVHQAR